MREAFSFWTGHPFDFELWVRTGYWVDNGMSPYGVLPVAPGLSFSNIYSQTGESTVGYLPFWPLVLGAIYKLYSLLGSDNQFVYYFLIKQPIIAGDLLLGYLISRYVKARRPDTDNVILCLWILSPLTIVISSIWGMFDSIAMVFVIAALITRSGTGRSIYEGVAIWAKSIPLIFAIPFALSGPMKLRNLIISLAVPVAGTIIPIVLLGWSIDTAVTTLGSTVSKGGQSLSAVGIFFYLQQLQLIKLQSFQLEILGYLWIAGVLGALALAYRWFGFTTEKGLVQSLILCTIAFMLFKAQVNEQYSIYLLALALVDVGVWSPRRRWIYVAATAVVMLFLIVNNGAFERFLSPVEPQAVILDSLATIAWGNARYAVLMACSLAFAAINVVYAWLLFQDRKTVIEKPAAVG